MNEVVEQLRSSNPHLLFFPIAKSVLSSAAAARASDLISLSVMPGWRWQHLWSLGDSLFIIADIPKSGMLHKMHQQIWLVQAPVQYLRLPSLGMMMLIFIHTYDLQYIL